MSACGVGGGLHTAKLLERSMVAKNFSLLPLESLLDLEGVGLKIQTEDGKDRFPM